MEKTPVPQYAVPESLPEAPAKKKSRRRRSRRPAGESTSARGGDQHSREREIAKPEKETAARAAKQTASGSGFAALGLHDDILAALKVAKFETPSDIQRELIPHALAGKDCIGQARTGTGKTAAFALPLLEMVKHGKGLQALVLVPTRELAKQVDDHVRMLGAQRGLKTALAYGGV
ncbi:MAG: DEAD/DEAH box helicase, partial [Planctomycetaceae bacterium]